MLPVSFTVDPDPRSITGLARFKVEIYAESGGEGAEVGDHDRGWPVLQGSPSPSAVPPKRRM